MPKYLTIFIVFALVAMAALGCGKKETPPEEMPMPMSVSVEGAATNMITRAGTPVQAGSVPEEIASTEEMPMATAAYIPPTSEEIQQALKNAGVYTGSVDGKIGPATKRAITEFQQQNGLTADGKLGKKTWEKLREYLNQAQQ